VDYRIAGELTNTDAVMNRTLWVGVYPGLTAPMMEWIAESFRQFAGRSHRASTVAVL
jgi:CDP-6-deoxy-D-xylo-4-hexulose-3-dehydrase